MALAKPTNRKTIPLHNLKITTKNPSILPQNKVSLSAFMILAIKSVFMFINLT